MIYFVGEIVRRLAVVPEAGVRVVAGGGAPLRAGILVEGGGAPVARIVDRVDNENWRRQVLLVHAVKSVDRCRVADAVWRQHLLEAVGNAVAIAVVLAVGLIDKPVAVEILITLHRVEDAVAVHIVVEVIGNSVAVQVAVGANQVFDIGRHQPRAGQVLQHLALDAVGEAVAVRVEIKRVEAQLHFVGVVEPVAVAIHLGE